MKAHPRDELQALLDGRLSASERAPVERHLAACASCRGELAALRAARDGLSARLRSEKAPPELTERVRAALDAEDEASRGTRTPPLWWPVAAAAALLLVAVLVPLRWAGPRGVVDEAGALVTAVASGAMELESRESDAAELARWFASRGLSFPARVFDFAAMGFELEGGRLTELAAEPAALYAYRGPDGARIVCQMYLGKIPPSADASEIHHRDDGVEFRTLERDGVVLVFWQEGEVACVMGATDVDAETVRSFAYAKAIAV